jgi:hypothetical protein
MRPRSIFVLSTVAVAAVLSSAYAALEKHPPHTPQAVLLGGKIYVYPGARVVLRNVDISRLPQITVQANGTVLIDGSANPGAPVAQW